jgi:hypothetical protein
MDVIVRFIGIPFEFVDVVSLALTLFSSQFPGTRHPRNSDKLFEGEFRKDRNYLCVRGLDLRICSENDD